MGGVGVKVANPEGYQGQAGTQGETRKGKRQGWGESLSFTS